VGWRDTLEEASFRGVQFGVIERGFATGRRAVVHEYPRRDVPFTEDLGRKARRFSVRAFVIGDDYTTRRDALLDACERAGPGEYVDRWLGTRQVICEQFRLTENMREGAFARFDLEFAEAGSNVVPAPIRGNVPVLGPVLESVISAIEEAFTLGFDTLTGNSFLQTEGELVLGGVVDVLDRVADRVEAIGGASEVQLELRAIIGESARLVRTSSELGPRLVAVTGALAVLEPDPKLRFERMLEVSDVDRALQSTSSSTVNRIRAARNQDALASLARRAGAVEAARAAGEIAFVSDREAAETRDLLLELIDAELEAASVAGDDDAFRELRALLAVSSESIKAKGATAARVITVSPDQTEPAEVFAYRLYADAERAGEIIDRNQVVHPLFLSGAGAFDVLTDG